MTNITKLIKRALQKTAHIFLTFSLLSALLLYPSLALHAEESFSVTDMNSTATVGDSTLNVRSGPGKEYDAIGRVSPGDTLTVTGETDNSWYQIDFSGKEGYVFSDYVTLGSGEESTAIANDPNDFTNYEEGAPQTDSILTASPKMLILLGVIVVIIAIMIGTIIMIKKSDEDEYDDDEDDIYYEDDDVEDDDEEYDDEEDEDEYYEEPVRRKKQVATKAPVKRPVSKPAPKPSTPVSHAPKQKAVQKTITEEDYTLQIDPRIFDDEKTVTASEIVEPVSNDPIPKETDAAILSKLEELQKEIERLKNERES